MAKFTPNPRVTAELLPDITMMIRACAEFVETEAKRRVPYDTGNLRRTIESGVVPGAHPVGIVAATADYAAHVEFGTSPHTITPKTKKALAWPGGDHPVKSVQHPGTEPQPYLRPALLALRGFLKRGI